MDYVVQFDLVYYESVVVPFLVSVAKKKDDEIKMNLINTMGEIVPWLLEKDELKNEELFLMTLDVMKLLLKDEEVKVRNRTLGKLCLVVKMNPLPFYGDYFISLFEEFLEIKYGIGTIVRAINNMTNYFSKDLDMTLFIPYYEKCAMSEYTEDKLNLLSSLDNFISYLDSDEIEKMIDLIVLLSKDPIWEIRKDSIKNILYFSPLTTNEIRTEKLIPTYKELLNDDSRWVKSQAFKYLGQIISTCEKKSIEEEIINIFKDMALEETELLLGNGDIAYYCAYNFPGVLQTLGKEYWIKLRDTYITLADHYNPGVRETVAHSMHHISEIIGPVFTETDLVEIIDMYLRDIAKVQYGIVCNIGLILAKISDPKLKKKYVEKIDDFYQSEKWRIRLSIAENIVFFAQMIDDEKKMEDILYSIAIFLLKDPVTEIRHKIIEKIGELLSVIPFESVKSNIVNEILSYGTGNTKERLLFPRICTSLVDYMDVDQFNQIFLPLLLDLVSDPVVNVRIGLANAIILMSTKERYTEIILPIIEKLRKDTDRDVIRSIGGTPPKYSALKSQRDLEIAEIMKYETQEFV